MATENNDLDNFFKKKDRKASKPNKQTGLLTNNEELHKRLVVVTSATSVFKENMDFDDDEEESTTNNYRHQVSEEPNGLWNKADDALPTSTDKSTTVNNKSKPLSKLPVSDNNNNHQSNDQHTGGDQQDEWEEFEKNNLKLEQLRLKLACPRNDDDGNEDDNEDYDHDGNPFDHETYQEENADGDEDQSSRSHRRRDQQQQQKDKPAWKLDQVKQTEPIPTAPSAEVPVEKVQPTVKPATTGAYRPPQLRGNAAVTVVSGVHQRVSKKEKPNLASTEEFPTLGATVNKK